MCVERGGVGEGGEQRVFVDRNIKGGTVYIDSAL
jgi:hypothetical protein